MVEATVRFLTRADTRAAGADDFALTMADIVEVLRLSRSGEAAMASEAVLPLGGGDPRAKAYALPATVGGRFGVAGLKWAIHRHAAGGGTPGIAALTLLNDLKSGLRSATRWSGALARWRSASAETAAVRLAVSSALSMMAMGRPLLRSLSRSAQAPAEPAVMPAVIRLAVADCGISTP